MKQRQTIGGNIWNGCSLALPCLGKFQYFVIKIARKLFFDLEYASYRKNNTVAIKLSNLSEPQLNL